MKKLHCFHCIRVVTDSNGTDQLGCIFSSEDTWFNFSSQRTQDTGYCESPASYHPPFIPQNPEVWRTISRRPVVWFLFLDGNIHLY